MFMAKRNKKIIVKKDHDDLNVITDTDIAYKIKYKMEFGKAHELNSLDWVSGTNLDILEVRKQLIDFVTYINQSGFSGETKDTKIKEFKFYVKYIVQINDGENLTFYNCSLICDNSIAAYQAYLHYQYNQEEIAKSTFRKKRANLKAFLVMCYNFDRIEFDRKFPIPGLRNGQLYGERINGAFNNKSYNRDEFELLVEFLIKSARFYKKLASTDSPIESLEMQHFEFKKNNQVFTIKHKIFNVVNADNYISNIASTLYLLVFVAISGINQSPAQRLTRDLLEESEVIQDIVKFKITDKRKKLKMALKSLLIKKHQRKLLDEILRHSEKVDPRETGFLFPFMEANKKSAISITNSFIRDLISNTLKPVLLRTTNGKHIVPSTRKLRHSYGLYFKDIPTRAKVLNNSQRTAEQSYNHGNIEENNFTLQTGMHSYENLLTNTKVIDENTSRNLLLEDGNAVRTPSGGICANAVTSPEAIKHTRKFKKLGIAGNNKTIHCTNFLACLTCKNHMFVDSEDDVYQLLSLKQTLKDSRYVGEAGGLFGNRKIIESAIEDISYLANNKIDKNLVIKARNKIKNVGISALWEYEL